MVASAASAAWWQVSASRPNLQFPQLRLTPRPFISGSGCNRISIKLHRCRFQIHVEPVALLWTVSGTLLAPRCRTGIPFRRTLDASEKDQYCGRANAYYERPSRNARERCLPPLPSELTKSTQIAVERVPLGASPSSSGNRRPANDPLTPRVPRKNATLPPGTQFLQSLTPH